MDISGVEVIVDDVAAVVVVAAATVVGSDRSGFGLFLVGSVCSLHPPCAISPSPWNYAISCDDFETIS